MKKIKYYILVILFFIGFGIGQIINTFAKTDLDYYEEIKPIRNKMGNIIGEEVIITIPKDYNKDIININTSVFDGFYHYSSNDSEFIVKITIDNKSKYNYEYIKNSLVIEPKNTNNSENYEESVKSDNITINDSYYRSYNSALKDLMPSGIDLSDDNIDYYLKSRGYNGINELNKYYDDYYGKWYSFALLLEGDVTEYKESNKVLIEDAYKYFYSHMLRYSCNDNTFGILNYKNGYCNSFSVFNKKSKSTISDMKIYLNRVNYFNNYLISVKFKFELYKSL